MDDNNSYKHYIDYEEAFRDITYPGVKRGVYLIGDCGTVVNKRRGTSLTWRYDKDGYPIVGLYKDDGGRSTYRVHRLVAWEFCEGYDESSGRTIVNHIDSDTSYPYYENLEWCTYSENTIHSFKYGNKEGIKGEASNFAKYNESQIREVCRLAEAGYDRRYISEVTGVTKSYLPDIINRKKWTHVSKDYNLPEVKTHPYRFFHEDARMVIMDLLRSGKRPMEICEILGLEKNERTRHAIENLKKKVLERMYEVYK